MTIIQVLPVPPNWVVFHCADHPTQVSPWQWEPLAYMALCADGGILPMLTGERGLSLPADNSEFFVCHPAAAREWLYHDTDIIEVEALERYLEAVQP